MSQSAMKKPIGVYMIATLFLLAPFGNILISFAGSNIQNWYDLSVIVPFLLSIPAFDWIWLGLLFVTGLLLFRPHKLSWSLAIFTLFAILSINAYRLYHIDANSIDPIFLKIFSVLAIICTLAVLVVAFYFRFPYLDRRANWLSSDRRFDLRTAVLVQDMKAVTESVSYSGCRFSFDVPCPYSRGERVSLKFPEISSHEVRAEVVDKLEFGARVEFLQPSVEFKQDLDRWIKVRLS